jgi:hypothetical protein
MTIDPSPTKWWGIEDWLYVLPDDGTEQNAGWRYLIDLERNKMGANEFLDRASDGTYVGLAEDWVQRAKLQGYPIQWLIMEKNAAQRWAMQYSFFRDWARSRGLEIREHETTNNKTDPTYGIWATLPSAYRYNRVRLPGADRASRLAVHPLVQEVTTYPGAATDDCVMSQWFGEYHLPNLISTRRTGARIYDDIPSWAGGPATDPITAKVAALAYR